MKRTSPSPPAEEAVQPKKLKNNHQSEANSAALRSPPSLVQALVQRTEEDVAHEPVAALLEETEAKQQELSNRLLGIRIQAALRALGGTNLLAEEAEQKQQEAEALLEAARSREAAAAAALAAVQKTQADLSSQKEALEKEASVRRNVINNALKKARAKAVELQDRETALVRAETELARAETALQTAAGPPEDSVEREEAAVAAEEADVARQEAALAAAASSQPVPLSQATNRSAATAGAPSEPLVVLKYRNAMVLLALVKGRKLERCYVCNEKGEGLVVCYFCKEVPIHPSCVDPVWATEGCYTSCALCKESAHSILRKEEARRASRARRLEKLCNKWVPNGSVEPHLQVTRSTRLVAEAGRASRAQRLKVLRNKRDLNGSIEPHLRVTRSTRLVAEARRASRAQRLKVLPNKRDVNGSIETPTHLVVPSTLSSYARARDHVVTVQPLRKSRRSRPPKVATLKLPEFETDSPFYDRNMTAPVKPPYFERHSPFYRRK